jgi:two-component system sensor histidine kinase/response regulator
VNLLGNALEFTKQGNVTIEVEGSPSRDKTFVLEVSIADTDICIPIEKQQTIFEAFTQADGSANQEYCGTELGLIFRQSLST